MMTSHSRCHGAPPREPWEFSAAFLDDFRRMDELKYKLMPYVYAQAKDSSERGLPMVRALFVEYPDDAGAWLVEDEYLAARTSACATGAMKSSQRQNIPTTCNTFALARVLR